MKLSTAHKIGRFFQYFVLILVGIIMIYPLVWMVGATFKSNAEIFSGIGFLTATPTLQGYIDAVTQNYGGDISIWARLHQHLQLRYPQGHLHRYQLCHCRLRLQPL